MADLEPIISNQEKKSAEEVLNNALGNLAKGLNVDIDQIIEFKKTLPIIPVIIPGMLYKGYALPKMDSDGKVICEFATSDPDDTNTAVHETIHWLHHASNPTIAQKEFNKKKAVDKKTSEIDPTSILQKYIGLDQAALPLCLKN